MKKNICIMAAVVMISAAFAGCSDNENNGGGTTDLSTSAETKAEESSSFEATTETVGDTETPQAASETGGEEAADNTVEKIAERIKSAYGDNYLPNTDIPPEMLKSLVGLEDDSYTEIFAQQPMIGAHPDMLIIAKAASGKTGDVKSKLEQYRDKLVSETMQYPMNIAKVNASKIVANGDYVAFILLGAINENDHASEAEQARFAEEQTEIGVKAFEAYFE